MDQNQGLWRRTGNRARFPETQIRAWTTRPPVSFPIPKATSAFVRIPVTKLLCNSSVALSTAELPWTEPRVWFSPLQDQTLTPPSPQLSISTFPFRYEQRVLIPGELRLCKTNRGRERFIMEHNYLAVHWRAAWAVLADSTSSSNSCPDSWSCLGFYQPGSLALCSDPNDQVAFTAATTSY